MKKIFISVLLIVFLVSCSKEDAPLPKISDETAIVLSDSDIQVTGINSDSVVIKNDIVYYEDGHDFTYGEGEENDAHSKEEADLHKVVHITKVGTYRLSGKLSYGQVAVDLGEDAESDPEAVVTLILDGVDITSTVAPAVIFYNVYECGDKDNATKDVDLKNAGARVIIEDDSVNTVSGSYVAKIYKPDTVELSEDKTEVLDAKKLHKYDAAFYSKMSMTLDGEGTLNINAENEGLDSELHLTIEGGNINIKSGNDGINTNEDGVSVTTINDGTLSIEVTGETGEGDGIDSNGWLVINGGTVIASACAFSGDAGIDSDMGIHINGGTVLATGHMLDRIEDGGQTFAVFNFNEKQTSDTPITLKDENGEEILSISPANAYSILIYSSDKLVEGTYSLLRGEEVLYGVKSEENRGTGMRPHNFKPENFNPEDMPKDITPPEKPFANDFPKGERPENLPEDFDPEKIRRPEGERLESFMPEESQLLSPDFVITKGGNYFQNIHTIN